MYVMLEVRKTEGVLVPSVFYFVDYSVFPVKWKSFNFNVGT